MFKNRHRLLQKTIYGENVYASVIVCENWSLQTSEILKDFTFENIFIANETGHFYECLPNKALLFKEEKCYVGKQSKKRITVVY